MHALEPGEFLAVFGEQAATYQSFPERVAGWQGAVGAVLDRHPEHIGPVTRAMAANESWTARSLAVYLLPRAAARAGWTDNLRELLRSLRRDEDSRVRIPAKGCLTSRE